MAPDGEMCFPQQVSDLLQTGLDLQNRQSAGLVSEHGSPIARVLSNMRLA
jgi:hypothetical protein